MPSEKIKNNYIKKVKDRNIIPNITFSKEIEFSKGLNIISGSNGVGKTLLLKYIQQNRTSTNIEFEVNDNALKNIASFSPKRNATKTLIEQARTIVRRDPNAKNTAINQFLNQQIQDDNIQTIKSISEYMALEFEEIRDREDLRPSETALKVKEEFSYLLNKIFDYDIIFDWISTSRTYSFLIIKNSNSLQPNHLSSGENAIISLIFSLYYSRDSAQIFLIDEPEVHLNWELEEKLFSFFNWFSDEFEKQLIIVTHSRACFMDPYLAKTQFLLWNGNQIEVVSKPTTEIQSSLAGDMVKIVSGITAESKLVYFEDHTHKHILSKLKACLNISLDIPEKLGNSSEVLKFSKAMKNLDIRNVYFLIDNDNKTIHNQNEYQNLTQLKRYCIENYFLDVSILENIDKRTDKTKPVSQILKESIKQVNKPNFAIVKELINAGIELSATVLERIDASAFVKQLAIGLGFSNKEDFFDKYIETIHEEGDLLDYFQDLREIIS